jgi:hypothetical protein
MMKYKRGCEVSKAVVLGALLVLAVFSSVTALHAANPVKVEVLYMNHGPLKDTLKKIRAVFSAYGNDVNVSWHDFESQDGEQFMAKMGIRQHVPLVIWINGSQTVTVGGKQTTFAGFPTGSGPATVQGTWTMDGLKAALDQATGRK